MVRSVTKKTKKILMIQHKVNAKFYRERLAEKIKHVKDIENVKCEKKSGTRLTDVEEVSMRLVAQKSVSL